MKGWGQSRCRRVAEMAISGQGGPGQEVAESMERRKLSWAPLESESYKTVMGQVRGGEMDGKESAVKLWLPSL